jgi:hypothetical protein
MHKLEQHYREVHNLLFPLERVFDEGPEGQKYRSFFSEELDANELEVALHAVCDFLLESSTTPISASVVDQIEVLHKKMAIEDDCTAKLRHRLEAGGDYVS